MKTTKTSEAIAERMRKRGFGNHMITWEADDGMFRVHVEGEYSVYKANAATVTAAYREVERQWQEDEDQAV